MVNIDDKTRRLSQATIVVGYKQENKAESIEFEIPEYLKEYGKKICFKTKDGKVFSKLFDNTTSNIFTFTRTETQYGELDATIEFFKTENEDMIIYKTSMLHIIFNESIICEDEVQPDEPKIPILESLIETVTDLNNTITENEETRNNNENTRISNEDSRIANETQRDIYYTGIQNKVNNGEFNGATYLPNVDAEGNISWTNNKGLENPSSQNIRGPQGVAGPQGEAFKIKKTYSSVEAMQADLNNMQVGDYVMITSNVEVEDNAKLYARTETEWVFITDFSGAQGIQGEQGPQGIQGIQGERGIGISRLEVIDGSLWVTLTDSTTQNAGLIITDEVKQWIVNQVTDNAKSDFNTYYNGKVTDFDNHVTEKTNEFNTNATDKTNEFNQNAESLKNKIEELKNQIPSGTASGNSIHLEDSSNMDFEWTLRGGSRQATRSGKNKLNFKNIDSTLAQSVTYSIKEGIITLDGTASGVLNIYSETFEVTETGQYTLSKNTGGIFDIGTGTSTPSILIQQKQTDGSFSTVQGTELSVKSTSNSITFKLEKGTYRLRIFTAAGNSLNNFSWKPQLENGIEATSYEQYGVSPSPDFPSGIQNVGDNINLLNKDTVDALNNLRGNALDTGRRLIANKDGTYTYGVFKLGGRELLGKTLGIHADIETTGGKPRISIFAGNSSSLTKSLLGVALSTSGTGYITLPSSLSDESDTISAVLYVTTDTSVVAGTYVDYTNLKVQVGDGEVIYSDYKKANIQITICNENYGTTAYWCLDMDSLEIYEGTSVREVPKSQVQTITFPLEEGQKLYEGSYLAKDGIHNKRISINGNEYKNMASMNRAYSTENYNCFDIYTGLKFVKSENQYKTIGALCNQFKEKNWASFWLQKVNEEGFCINRDNRSTIYIKISKEICPDIDTFKKYIDENNLLFEIPLATEEIIPYTQEQQAVIDKILYTYKNVTNISVDNKLATLDITYKKDIETMFNNIIKQISSSTSDTAET